MRGLRSTLALLVVLIALGAYIYFVTWKQPVDAGSKQEEVFASLEAADIQEFKVKSASGETTTVKKDGSAWQIVDPITAPAAESEASSVTSALGGLEIVRVIDENPADLKEYGLATPRIEIDFKSTANKPSGRLLIGDKTPTGANLYAMRNEDKRVFLISEYQESSLNRSTFDLRDKALVKLQRDKVNGVQVNIAGKPIEFAKEGDNWKMTQPLAARADSGSVEALVGRVETAQMKSIVTDTATPAELRKYGLDKPEVSVTVSMGGDRATLLLGGKASDDAVYAREPSKPFIVTVENSLAEDLKKSAEDYRRKEAFEFRAFNATHAEFTRGDQTIAFERVKGQGENAQDSWRRISPTAGDVDRSKVESLLAGVADIRVTSFVQSTANTGLAAPAMTVFVKFDEGKKEERVTFGRSGKEVYISRPGDPGAGKIEAEKFDEAIKALDELAK